MTRIAGAISAYGAAKRANERRVTRRRRSGIAAPAASRFVLKVERLSYVLAFSIDVICLLADAAAAATVCLPDTMFVSMLRRTFAFSTFAQFFAVGTNQLELAAFARCDPGVPLTRLSRAVLFGRLPDLTISPSFALFVKSAIQSSASALFWLATGIARSEPPAKDGIVLPATWLGIANA